MGKLILIRHGESEGNRDRRFTISPEAPITELGRRQACEAALRIKERFRPVLVIASSYRRARETGEIIAAQLNLPIETTPRLREQSLGELAGKPYEAVGEDPAFDPMRSWLWRPPGGESHVDVRTRVAPVLDEIARRYADQEVVVVSHGGVMRSLWAHVTGSWEDAPIPPNCGIVLVEHAAGSYRQPVVIAGDRPASFPPVDG